MEIAVSTRTMGYRNCSGNLGIHTQDARGLQKSLELFQKKPEEQETASSMQGSQTYTISLYQVIKDVKMSDMSKMESWEPPILFLILQMGVICFRVH